MTRGGVTALSVALLMTPVPALGRVDRADVAIASALERCLASTFVGAKPEPSPALSIPPGLIEGEKVRIDPIPAPRLRAFAYEGVDNRVHSCGIAIYGHVSKKLRSRIVEKIEHNGRLQPQSLSFWNVTAAAEKRSYWGDPRAPGIIGTLMLERPGEHTAPALEIQYHRLLVD